MNPIAVSISQISKKYGLNPSHIQTLITRGDVIVADGCAPLRPKIVVSSVESLSEGIHYIKCLECGAFQGLISDRHLKMCSGITSEDYFSRYPDAPFCCLITEEAKKKTEDQKQAQSDKLKARFQTPEGEITRQQIIMAARRLMASGHTTVLRECLKRLREDPGFKERYSKSCKMRWATGNLRATVREWHRSNPERSRASAANARAHTNSIENLKKARDSLNTTSNLHLKFKDTMLLWGLQGFVTEGSVGPFHIDELHDGYRLAVEIDGCYWHGCPQCGFEGVARTLSNDQNKNRYLEKTGYQIIRLRECWIKNNPAACIDAIKQLLKEKACA